MLPGTAFLAAYTGYHCKISNRVSYSDSVEKEETLGDNSVQLQSFVQYEPDLFVSM